MSDGTPPASGCRLSRCTALRQMLSRILGLVGLTLLIVGVVVATRPIRVLSADCGSVIRPAGGITPMNCDERLNDHGTLALAVGVAGFATVITSLGIALLSSRKTRP